MARAEQTEIPGTERPKIIKIENAAKKYEAARDERMDRTKDEVEASEKLQKVLHESEDQLTERDEDGNPAYVYNHDGELKMAILVRSEEKVKVKKYKVPKSNDDDKADA